MHFVNYIYPWHNTTCGIVDISTTIVNTGLDFRTELDFELHDHGLDSGLKNFPFTKLFLKFPIINVKNNENKLIIGLE
jgi:hypothetical protein